MVPLLVAGCSSRADPGAYTATVEGAFEEDLAGGEILYEEFLPSATSDGGSHMWIQRRGPGDTFLVIDVSLPAVVAPGTYDLQTPLLVRPGSGPSLPDRTAAALLVSTADESPIFDRDVTGTLEITAGGETLSGSFRFTAYEAVPSVGGGVIAGDRSVDVEGTFEEVPLVVVP